MTAKKSDEPADDDSLGVLDDSPSSDTTGFGLLGGTAQVRVSMPTGADEDDLAEDETIADEIGADEIVTDLILDTSAVADPDTLARIEQQAPEIVIELPADQLPPVVEVEPATDAVETIADETAANEDAGSVGIALDTSEIVVETEDIETGVVETVPADETEAPVEHVETAPVVDEPAVEEPTVAEPAVEESAVAEPAVAEPAVAEPAAAEPEIIAEPETVGDRIRVEDAGTGSVEPEHPATEHPEPDNAENERVENERVENEPVDSGQRSSADLDDSELLRLESVVAAAKAQLRDAMAPTPRPQKEAPLDIAEPEEESTPVVNEGRAPEARPTSEIARTREEAPRTIAEVSLTARRLDDLGAAGRESADLLTADRLLDPSRLAKPEPEGTWSHLLYSISGGRINVGDSRKARERKQLNARIAAPMSGTARFVPVLSRKGGVGKTTVTALLGMALADARDDRVIAVDANPDRGTLAERVVGSATKSVRDMVRAQHDIRGFHDISALVARDHTRLDVLASDADPRVSEAFGDADYRDVAAVAAQYYSLVLTDSGTGIVHSVMGATLDLADQIVIVSGLSVDEARLASETLTWLETNGHADLAREAIVVLNQSTPGTPLVRLSELEAHFSTRAKHVLRIPYDTQIAGGGTINFASLQPATRQAAREIAATLVEGLRAQAA